jgi:nucleoid-associated protein YgaU
VITSKAANGYHFKTGQRQGGMYVVKSGDSLSKIAKSYYGNANDYKKIADANNIDDPNKIQAGQQLKIPAA